VVGRGLAAPVAAWARLSPRDHVPGWLRDDRIAVASGLLAPPATSAVLAAFRTSVPNASLALILIVVVVAVAASGHRAAGVLGAVSATAGFDVFLTRPYGRLSIATRGDVQTTLLLLAVGLAVTELAVRGRQRHRAARVEAALRRVATLVAGGAPAQAVFDAVAEETGRLIGATTVNLAHFTPDDFNLTMSGWSLRGVHVPTGSRLPLEGYTINRLVQQTRAPGRMDSYQDAPGLLAARLRELGIRSEVGAPVVVDGQVWGALIAGTDRPRPLPAGAEQRVARFAELIALAVANATARDELIASRARIVTAADEARRRLARDLHDGAQQRLVSTVMSLQLADQRFDRDAVAARQQVRAALGQARDGLAELRELAAGMHPSILTNRGLAAAVEALAQRSTLPVQVRVPDVRYPAHVEAAAYFVVAEALTNAAKHARPSRVQVRVDQHDGTLRVEIDDDGVGGAALHGNGLRGLKDRVEALGGALRLDSPPGHGTRLQATLPLTAPY
jgi:signal transduction histidine kinase